jgi:hypothetical protein
MHRCCLVLKYNDRRDDLLLVEERETEARYLEPGTCTQLIAVTFHQLARDNA